MAWRLPDLSDDQLTLLLGSLYAGAIVDDEIRDFAQWLSQHAWQPHMPPEIARLVNDTRRSGPLELRRIPERDRAPKIPPEGYPIL